MLFLTSALVKRWRSVVTLLLLLPGICCSPQPSQQDQLAPVREVIDDVGRRVSLPANVDRIISLAPNLTEIVFAVQAQESLVGVTSYCDYPEAAKTLEKVGDTLQPNIERIIGLRPQVVLVSTASQLEAFTRQLDSHRIAVFVTDPRDLEGVFHSIYQLGQVLNKRQNAERLVENLRSRTAAVEEAVKGYHPVKVFYQLSDEPLYTAGKDSFVTDLIRRAGGASVTAEVPGAWPRYSAETALASQPEAIILATGGSTGTGNSEVTDSLQRSRAVAHGKVFKINADHLSRPGPRSVDGLEAMARALHPNAFKQ